MTFFWVKHRNGAGTIEATSKVAAAEKATELGLGEIVVEGCLPYPAYPVLHQTSGCPPFCFNRDNQCVGRLSCPRNYACSE